MYVQFSDDKKEIVSVFGSPQDPKNYKNLGEVEENDPRLIEYIDRQKGNA